MKNLKKSHWLLIIISVLILVSSIGITAWLLFSNYQNVKLFKQAQNNFLHGDDKSLLLAEAQLLQLIRHDSDNEAAYIMLGAIAEKRKIYPEQAYYCFMAHRLNPLSAENKERYIKSLCYARYLDRLEVFLTQAGELSEKNQQLLLYSAARNGSLDKYKHQFKLRGNDHALGELTSILFQSKNLTAEQKLAALNNIDGDDFIRQEVWASRAELYLTLGDIDNAEKALQQAYELNSYAFAAASGSFYANFRTLKQALSIYENHLTTYHDPVMALKTAEIYCLLGKSDEITKLRNQYQADSGSSAMLLCYYLDAMNALRNNDMASLKELLIPLRKNLNTPLALFMFFCADLQEGNPETIRESYSALNNSRGYLQLKLRADDMLQIYLKNNFQNAAGKEQQILQLAQQLYDRKPEAFTAKLILLIQKKSSSVNLLLLKDALKRFPHDHGVIKLAIEYTLTDDLAECAKLIKNYKQNFPDKSSDMLRYEIMLAARKNDLDLVSELFQKNFSPAVRREYWNFASSTMRENDLKFLSKEPLYAPFCQALLLLKKGDNNAACNLLEKSDAQGDIDLMFFAAKVLAENGRNQSALHKYKQIPANSPYAIDVLMNMSELYAELGNNNMALSLSEQAYRSEPDLAETQFCYADKLHRSNRLAEIPDIIKLKSTSSLRKRMEFLWIAGMQQRIQDCNLQTQRERARVLCRQLLLVCPDNSVALEFLKKLNKMPQ